MNSPILRDTFIVYALLWLFACFPIAWWRLTAGRCTWAVSAVAPVTALLVFFHIIGA